MLISLMASCYSFGFDLKEDFGITLTAKTYLVFWCIALKTCP